jgi:hypothetical protein
MVTTLEAADIFLVGRRHPGLIESTVQVVLILFRDVMINPLRIVFRRIDGCRNAELETYVIILTDIHQTAR